MLHPFLTPPVVIAEIIKPSGMLYSLINKYNKSKSALYSTNHRRTFVTLARTKSFNPQSRHGDYWIINALFQRKYNSLHYEASNMSRPAGYDDGRPNIAP